MPIYEFMCGKCLKITQESLPINSNKKLTDCRFCKRNRARKIISQYSGYRMNGYSEKNGYAGEKK